MESFPIDLVNIQSQLRIIVDITPPMLTQLVFDNNSIPLTNKFIPDFEVSSLNSLFANFKYIQIIVINIHIPYTKNKIFGKNWNQ